MKNFVKYVFIIFVIGIMIFVFYKSRSSNNSNNEEEKLGQVKDDGIIREITLGMVDYDTINPLLSQNKYVQEISKIIYEPLLEFDEQYKLKKCLARDWAKTSNVTYLIKIQKDVKWSNGANFTVEDVIFTIYNLKQVQSIYSQNVQNITRVDKIDDETLQITLDQEINQFEYNLIFPIMCRNYYDGDNFSTSLKNIRTIGTGKYKITANNESEIVLERNENYSRIELNLEKITIQKYSSLGEMYNAFKLGKLDLITTNNSDIENYIGTIGYNEEKINGRNYTFVALNTQNKVLSDSAARNAIYRAINRENIVANVFGGKYKIIDYPLDYGSWLSGEKADTTYNPDVAKQILENNGWVFKYNRWQKTVNYSTTTLNFKIVVQASNGARNAVAEMIKADLENIGINVTIVKASDEQYNSYLNNKNYDAIITGMTMSLSQNLDLFFGGGNLANYNNEEVSTIMGEIRSISKEDVLKEKYDRIREIYNAETPYIGLYTDTYSVITNWTFRGNIKANWYNIYEDVNNWYKN